MRYIITNVMVSLFLCLAVSCSHEKDVYRSWRIYQGDPGSNSYSKLDQINRKNVDKLEVSWTYHSGDKDQVKWKKSTSECNPIIVDGVMYLTSPALKVVALNAANGDEIWRFDPFEGDKATGVNRGVVYWESGDDKRILFTAGSRLYALSAKTGSVISSFGEQGQVDLRERLDRDPEKVYVVSSSPGIIYKDMLILGSSVGEVNGAAPGYIRAYNVRNGEIEWVFHTIPHPDEKGSGTWGENAWKTLGGTNNWAGMSIDRDRGIVFVPTGSPSPQLIGVGKRRGKNLFGNSILALDAGTGKRIWHYQIVHHDLWDYDLPAPPNLVTVQKDWKKIDAVAQVTKHGFIFLLDRTTGEPIFPVKEQPVPGSTTEGEESWPTQPFPTLPVPFTRQNITENDLTDISPAAHKYAVDLFHKLKYEGLFTPVGEPETLFYPGSQGGAEWGGASFDPKTGILYINANEFGYIFSLKKIRQQSKKKQSIASAGKSIFQMNCAGCHGGSVEEASSEFPSLNSLDKKYTKSDIRKIIQQGRGRMPGFPQLSGEEKNEIIAYLFNMRGKEMDSPKEESDEDGTASYRYAVDTAYKLFGDEKGYPATKPPWGSLNAIDLNTGKQVWKVPLGEYPELKKQGALPTGTRNLGGSIVTAGGLVFIGAAKDEKFRAFDKKTGKILWEYQLPAGGYATPSTYEIDGRQYVVIAATGGGNMGTRTGDSFLAFSLPDNK